MNKNILYHKNVQLRSEAILKCATKSCTAVKGWNTVNGTVTKILLKINFFLN